jgi:hypothetical protein
LLSPSRSGDGNVLVSTGKTETESFGLKSLDFESHAVATAMLQLAEEKENGRTAITTLYKSAKML